MIEAFHVARATFEGVAMKTVLTAAAGAAGLISGCAFGPNAETAAYNNVDSAKVAAIENAAKASGVTVKWINYPQKKSSAVGAANAPAEPTGT